MSMLSRAPRFVGRPRPSTPLENFIANGGTTVSGGASSPYSTTRSFADTPAGQNPAWQNVQSGGANTMGASRVASTMPAQIGGSPGPASASMSNPNPGAAAQAQADQSAQAQQMSAIRPGAQQPAMIPSQYARLPSAAQPQSLLSAGPAPMGAAQNPANPTPTSSAPVAAPADNGGSDTSFNSNPVGGQLAGVDPDGNPVYAHYGVSAPAANGQLSNGVGGTVSPTWVQDQYAGPLQQASQTIANARARRLNQQSALYGTIPN